MRGAEASRVSQAARPRKRSIDYREKNADPIHQRRAAEVHNRMVHDIKRDGGPALSRKEQNLRSAIEKVGLRVLAYEHEIPTDPPAWIDALVEADGRPWYVDCSPFYGNRRPLEERKKAILRRKQEYAKDQGIPLVLLTGTIIEMQAVLELERLKQKGKKL
jgi:hypothetical protein